MRNRFSFDERWEQEERKFKIFEHFVIGFIIFVVLLMIASLVLYGFFAYKLIENPEMIGDWFNKLITSFGG